MRTVSDPVTKASLFLAAINLSLVTAILCILCFGCNPQVARADQADAEQLDQLLTDIYLQDPNPKQEEETQEVAIVEVDTTKKQALPSTGTSLVAFCIGAGACGLAASAVVYHRSAGENDDKK